MIDPFLLDPMLTAWLAEDLPTGDVTGSAIFDDADIARGFIVAREDMMIAGIKQIAARVFSLVDPEIVAQSMVDDGDMVLAGTRLMEIKGRSIAIMAAERLALNLAMRLSGIATTTAGFVAAVAGTGTRITDTRKTTPGLRLLEKDAVRCGGGYNHRFGLSDGVLIKDNHIAACGSITAAVKRVREKVAHTLKIEVECDTLTQVKEALACHADIIMLDNMDTETIKNGVALIDGRAITEASGSMTVERVRETAETGVDYISVGGLTHSAPAVDMGLDLHNQPGD